MIPVPKNIAILEPSVASECVVSEMTGQIRCGSPFLAGILAQHGFDARVFAEELINFDAPLMDRIVRDYDAVGISATINTLPRAMQVIRALKRRRPTLPIAIGGPSASAFADRLLQRPPGNTGDPHSDFSRGKMPETSWGADAVFRGRAEISFSRWLKVISEKDAWAEIPGMVFRNDLNLVVNRSQPEIPDGETRYDLVESFGPQTLREGLFGSRKPAVYSFFASTGCVRQCRFCQTEKHYVPRNHELVGNDLQRILKLHGTSTRARIMLVDDCFFGDLARTKELLRRIEHANVEIQHLMRHEFFPTRVLGRPFSLLTSPKRLNPRVSNDVSIRDTEKSLLCGV